MEREDAAGTGGGLWCGRCGEPGRRDGEQFVHAATGHAQGPGTTTVSYHAGNGEDMRWQLDAALTIAALDAKAAAGRRRR